MVLGIGVDIMHVDQIKNYLKKENPKPFLRKVYTESELQGAVTAKDKELFYTLRFSGKEAIYKALDIPNAQFHEMEILNTASGKPIVVLHGLTRSLADEKGVQRIEISFSSDKGLEIANAVALE